MSKDDKNNKNRLPAPLLSFIFAVALLAGPQTIFANILPSAGALELIKSSCKGDPGKYQELAELKLKITAAETLEDARQLALEPTDDAIAALNKAHSLVPFSDDLQTAETRLSDARSRIMLASSQAQVADEFDGMMLASLDNDRAAHVKVGSGSCNYSTGELIGIVVGLILGIIPGLILLVVLC